MTEVLSSRLLVQLKNSDRGDFLFGIPNLNSPMLFDKCRKPFDILLDRDHTNARVRIQGRCQVGNIVFFQKSMITR